VQDTRNFELAVRLSGRRQTHPGPHLAFYTPRIDTANLPPGDAVHAEDQTARKERRPLQAAPNDDDFGVTRGFGVNYTYVPKPEVNGVDPDQKIDDPCLVVEIIGKAGDSQGTVLLTPNLERQHGAEEIKIGDKTYELSIA